MAKKAASMPLRPAALPLGPAAMHQKGACMALRGAGLPPKAATSALEGATLPLPATTVGEKSGIDGPRSGNAAPSARNVAPSSGNAAPKWGNGGGRRSNAARGRGRRGRLTPRWSSRAAGEGPAWPCHRLVRPTSSSRWLSTANGWSGRDPALNAPRPSGAFAHRRERSSSKAPSQPGPRRTSLIGSPGCPALGFPRDARPQLRFARSPTDRMPCRNHRMRSAASSFLS